MIDYVDEVLQWH